MLLSLQSSSLRHTVLLRRIRAIHWLTHACIHFLPQDNYVWVLKEPSGKVAIIDPSEAKPVAAALEKLGWQPDYILNTHHHWDHTG